MQHYIHTLLAAKGLVEETSCRVEGVAAADWSKGGEHPKSNGWVPHTAFMKWEWGVVGASAGPLRLCGAGEGGRCIGKGAGAAAQLAAP